MNGVELDISLLRRETRVTFNGNPKEDMESLEVRIITPEYRGVFAKRDVKKGQVIGRFQPLSTFKATDKIESSLQIGAWTTLMYDRLKTINIEGLKILEQVWGLYPRLHFSLEVFFKKLSVNCYKTLSGGFALYKTLSYVNHSCRPNSINSDGTFLALRNISKGDEIVTSYSNLEDPTERRKFLLDKYDFLCRCTECSKLPEIGAPNQCAFCKNQRGCLLRCTRCKETFYCDTACQKKHWKDHKGICK